MKKYGIVCLLSLGMVLSCHQNIKAREFSRSDYQNDWHNWNKSLSDKASLINRLNQDVIYYGRVPNLWGLFFTPKGNSLSKALSSSANQRALSQLQRGLLSKIQQMPPKMKALFEVFFYKMRAPLELAVFLPQGSPITSSQIIIETKFDFDSVEELNALFDQVSTQNPQFKLMQSASNDQPGLIFMGPMKLYYQFDAKNQRFTALTGMAVLSSELSNVLNWSASSNLPVQNLQNRMESSGTGVYQWLNVEKVLPLVKNSIPPSELPELKALGLLDTTTLAIGIGVNKGIGKFSMLGQGKDGLIWNPIFKTVSLKKVHTAGRAEIAAGFNLPDSKAVNDFIKEIAALQENPVKRQSIPDNWIDLKMKIKQKYQVSIDQFIDAIAGQYVVVSDKAGEYNQFIASHPGKLAKFLQDLSKKGKAKDRVIAMGGLKIHEFSYRFELPAKKKVKNPIANLMQRFYYIEKNGVFIMAAVPQILVDRKNFRDDVPLQPRLASQQIRPENDFFWMLSNSRNIPRKNYYTYLNMLQMFSDLVDTNIDISSFPSANELELPVYGNLGLEWMLGKGELGFSINYESHMGEYFMDNNTMVTVAVIGIMAAVAIPAYQDYTKRAKMNKVLVMSIPAKREVEKYYRANGAFPGSIKQGQNPFPKGSDIESLEYDGTSHHIVIRLSPHFIKQQNATLHLIPKVNPSGITWKCRAYHVKKSWLPIICR